MALDSPYWKFRDEYNKLDISVDVMASLSREQAWPLFLTIFEELGYGDSGLAISVGAGMLPKYIATLLGRRDLASRIADTTIGCWGITEPDHGTDMLDPSGDLLHPQGSYGRPNCIARITDGTVIINGQKAAWVSNAPVAEVAILYCALETAKGVDPHAGVCVIVPLDAPGVSRGKVLPKLGQRALPQGELFFDNVTLDSDYILAGPEDYKKAVYLIHCEANALMGAVFAGAARSAYDLAFAYAHERTQGGVPIVQHQAVRYRLLHMFRKVEMAAALVHRVLSFNMQAPQPALQAGICAKITSTETAFEVASAALQMFGGNGLTHEYPIEKILRDARASMIEDGCNEMLAIKGGTYLRDPDRLPGLR